MLYANQPAVPAVSSAKKIADAVELLELQLPSTLNLALSQLLQKSSEADTMEPIMLERFPKLLGALTKLMDKVNPLRSMYLGHLEAATSDAATYAVDVLSHNETILSWPTDSPFVADNIYKNLARTVDEIEILMACLAIVRNLSFELNNVLPLAYNNSLMIHMASIMITVRTNSMMMYSNSGGSSGSSGAGGSGSGSFHLSEASRLCFGILSNIGHKVDIVGAKRKYHKLWMGDVLQYNIVRYQRNAFASQQQQQLQQQQALQQAASYPADGMNTKSCEEMHRNSLMYTLASKDIISVLFHCVGCFNDRSVVMRSLDIIAQLAVVAENSGLFSNCPRDLLWFIADLIYCNQTAVDPFRFGGQCGFGVPSTIQNNSVTVHINRVPPATMTTRFHVDVADIELRDIALETIIIICSRSKSLQQLFGHFPRFINQLCRIITEGGSSIPATVPGAAGGSTSLMYSNPSATGAAKATNLLTVLAQCHENRDVFLSNQKQLCALACADDAVAELVGHFGDRLFHDTIIEGYDYGMAVGDE